MSHADAAPYAYGTEDAAVRAFAHLPAPQYTPESVTHMIDGVIAEGLARGDLAVLTIATTDSDDFAGSLVLFDVRDGSAEVGFWLSPEARGAGLAAAALGLAGRWAGASGLRVLTARTATGNLASQHVLEKGGFRPRHRAEGTAPSGARIELIHYELDLGATGDSEVAGQD